jgi:hypothetical protein
MYRNIALFILIHVLVFGVAGQQEFEPVSIKSWKKGPERIKEKSINVTLSREESEFRGEIAGTKGEVFELRIIYRPIERLRRDHWAVQLFELTSKRNERERVADLFDVEVPGPGGNSFPGGWEIKYLYPETRPFATFNKTRIMAENQLILVYPLKQSRIFYVAGFKATVKVNSIELDEDDMDRVLSLDLVIAFSNVGDSAPGQN